MTLKEQLVALVEERALVGLNKQKALTAITSLVSLLGDRPVSAASTEPDRVGQIVRVPEDDEVWVVYYEYVDGTLDIIRAGAVEYTDRLVGWRMGESVDQYKKRLHNEFAESPSS